MTHPELIGLLLVAVFSFEACGASVDADGRPEKSDAGGRGADVVPKAARKRVLYFRNGTLGKIVDSAEARSAVNVADEECTRGASQMGLNGSWKAWLSSSQIDAVDRISDVGPWYRVDQETLLFASKEEFTRGPRLRIDPAEEVFDWDN